MSDIHLKDHITSIPDFPKPGIIFRDITTLIQSKEAFAEACRQLAERIAGLSVDLIAAPEARGFLFAAPLALTLGCGIVPVRKPGKLPRKVLSQSYDLEYGTDTLTIHEDAIPAGSRVLIIDDLLATGGTVEACRKLVEQAGGKVVGYGFVMELSTECDGRKRLETTETPVFSLIQY
ncbi:MAG: adenine phosphoribosyltransferase [Planctomycetia bacterium]|nr:adenine phosphoribosyltransferase [Planctomycetia bacterium]